MSNEWKNSEEDAPRDLQVCIGWCADTLSQVFVQWLDGPKLFVDAEGTWKDTVTNWRPLTNQFNVSLLGGPADGRPARD